MFGPFTSVDLCGLRGRQGWFEHGGVHAGPAGQLDPRVVDSEQLRQLTGIGDPAGQRGRRRGFRGTQVDGVLRGSGSSREVTGEGPQAVAADRGGLPHADAAHAAGLVQPGPGRDQVEGAAHLREVLQDLPGGRVDVEGHPWVGLPAADDSGDDGEVAQPRVGR